MKTRNNDSTPNETILNQNITRRSFVKRGAVASAATVFGSFSASADAPVLSVPYQKGQTVTYSGPAINKTWTPSSDNPPIPAMEQLLNWLGWDDQYQPARTPGDWTVTPIMDTYNPYTEKIVPLKGDKDGNPVVTPGAGFPANAITATGTSATINLPTGSSYTVINTKKVPLKP